MLAIRHSRCELALSERAELLTGSVAISPLMNAWFRETWTHGLSGDGTIQASSSKHRVERCAIMPLSKAVVEGFQTPTRALITPFRKATVATLLHKGGCDESRLVALTLIPTA